MTNSVYHPILNGNGTYKASDNKFWYETTVTLNSVADCFNPANIGTVNGRPDGKSDKYVYAENMIDVREYAKIVNKYEIDLIRDDKVENGVEEMVSMVSTGNIQTFTALTNDVLVNDPSLYYIGQEIILIQYGTSPYLSPTQKITNIVGNAIVFEIPYNRVSGDNVVIVSTKPILSSGTKLSIDLIGNPTNYPQIMKDRLASGVGVIGVNPLLVGQDGTSYIPDGTIKYFINSSKQIGNWLNYVNSDDNGVTYNNVTATAHGRYDSIGNNTYFTYTLDAIAFGSYISKNKPYIQTTPKPVIEVEPKVIATNSHSLYKGALIGNQVSGKIQVGGAYESRVLENSDITADYEIKIGSTLALIQNSTYLILDKNMNDASYGEVYERTGATTGVTTINANSLFRSNANMKLLGYTDSLPIHSTISLDNSTSSASKYFNTLEEGDNGVLAGVYGEEITYDSVSEWGDTDFSQLANGTIPDVNGGSDVRTFYGVVPINGRIK